MCSIRIFIWNIFLLQTGSRCFLMILLNAVVQSLLQTSSFQGYWMRHLSRIHLLIPFWLLVLLRPLILLMRWSETGSSPIRKTQACRSFFLNIWSYCPIFLLGMSGIFWFIWIFCLTVIRNVLIQKISIYRSLKIIFYWDRKNWKNVIGGRSSQITIPIGMKNRSLLWFKTAIQNNFAKAWQS